jgi:hypothetical protein
VNISFVDTRKRGRPVGEGTVRPRGARIAADGAVALVRRGTRVTRKGKAVTARLALQLDESVAGEMLSLDVTTVDARGRRQVEHIAGTVRVAE